MFWKFISQHPGKVIGVVTGLILGLLYIFVGFLNTLVLIVLTSVGFYLGGKFDNRESLMDVLDRVLPGKYTRH